MTKGYTITARQAYLRASNYIRTSEFFLKPDDPRKVTIKAEGYNVCSHFYTLSNSLDFLVPAETSFNTLLYNIKETVNKA